VAGRVSGRARRGRLAQLGERRVRNAEVRSSILLPSTNFSPLIIADGHRVGDLSWNSAGTAINVRRSGDYISDTGS
jgi:hypothetical protein